VEWLKSPPASGINSPADHATERGTRVDFTARQPVESPTAFAVTLKRYLTQ